MKIHLFILMGAVLAAACGWGAEEKAAPPAIVKKIGVEEFEKLRANTNVVVIDVRSKAEVEKGRIPDSINIEIASPRFDETIGALDKSKIYVVHCAVGMRSARACKKMETMGFKQLYDFSAGYDGWRKAEVSRREEKAK